MSEQDMKSLCLQHMHRYVGVQMEDGSYHDGIVEMVDDDYLYLAVPIGGAEMEAARAYSPFYGYAYPYPYPYPSPNPYPYYGFPRRRFFRRALPLASLLALSLLPYY